MRDWMRRLTLLAVVGALLSSVLVAGCGGGEEDGGEDTANTANTANATP